MASKKEQTYMLDHFARVVHLYNITVITSPHRRLIYALCNLFVTLDGPLASHPPILLLFYMIFSKNLCGRVQSTSLGFQ